MDKINFGTYTNDYTNIENIDIGQLELIAKNICDEARELNDFLVKYSVKSNAGISMLECGGYERISKNIKKLEKNLKGCITSIDKDREKSETYSSKNNK